MRILIIEDNRDIAINIGDYLEEKGHTVDFAGDGITGLHLAIVNDFDAIVLDLALPGMDGLEFLKRIQKTQPNALKVLITAYKSKGVVAAALKIGIQNFIEKPFTTKTIEKSLTRLIENHEQGID